jgi:hypothetical protein
MGAPVGDPAGAPLFFFQPSRPIMGGFLLLLLVRFNNCQSLLTKKKC